MIVLGGDSLMVGVQHTGVVHYDRSVAREREHVDHGIRRLRAVVHRGDTVLVSLGTNDLGHSRWWMARRVRRVLRMVGADGCVLWSYVYVTWAPVAMDELNLGLIRVRDGDRRLVLVRPATPGKDGVHPKDYKVLARHFQHAKARCR